jgi:DNA-binding Xre family transcriptional regulator
MQSPWAKPAVDTAGHAARTLFQNSPAPTPPQAGETQSSHTPMDVLNSSFLKRSRDMSSSPPPTVGSVVGSNDPGEGDDDTSVGLSESEVTRLQTNNWKFVRRYEQLAGECDVLESKISRLCQELEYNPDDPDTRDTLGGAQSSLHKMQQAMRRLHSSIEVNCQQLNEEVDVYLPYEDVA